MASSPSDNVYMYPDPSLLGRLPLQQLAARAAARATALAAPVVAPPPQVTAPATISTTSAPSPAPIVGPVPTQRPSAAGLQPFPTLGPGLQAPVELTHGAQIAKWNRKLALAFNDTGVARASLKSRKSRARIELKKLWEAAGGAPYVPGLNYKRG